MNKIYLEIAELSEKFKEMCLGMTNNKTDIEEAVQELCLYFMQMNPDTLKSIYEKDGRNGLIRYGAVVLKRALTSTRSPFYYKYKKYYTNILTDAQLTYRSTMSHSEIHDSSCFYKSLYNMPEEILEKHQYERLEVIDQELDKLHWYDQGIFKLYYYEGNTLDSLAKKTGISRNSLFTTIDKVREILKAELNE